MTNPSDDVMAKLQALRDTFATQLPGKIQEIKTIVDTLCGGKCGEAEESEAFKVLHYLSHKLTGSGATFGFSAVSDAARALETLAKEILDLAVPSTAVQRAQIRVLLEDLQRAAGQRERKSGANYWQESGTPAPRAPDSAGENRLIYLVEDDPLLAQDLALQLGNFNYTTHVFHSLAAFRQAVRQTIPAALVMDMGLPDGNGADAIVEIQEGRAAPLPVIFLSGRGDLEARLAGVRAGGAAYFTKPVDIGAMVDALDTLTAQKAPEPYRILIVDDTPSLARYFALTLQEVGMVTEVVTDPMNIMQALVEFAPELILMDMYMPGCNGLELAMVIRQQEAYVGIPIVFLSAETDLNKQLEAMRQGGGRLPGQADPAGPLDFGSDKSGAALSHIALLHDARQPDGTL
ncbi:MAG: response regulator [Gammaproteobacteria bacterium]